eukprot:TRINITY_DN24774_c0_g1_i1.p1 TRINITY_DN24774_c0_g1~~TRINITY_DN24774_c0_g1_i1.p1  ORF type:complete len:429 (+),score=109.48 TRINITY_DN24774_c0_g1_i1:1431-2717(+)
MTDLITSGLKLALVAAIQIYKIQGRMKECYKEEIKASANELMVSIRVYHDNLEKFKEWIETKNTFEAGKAQQLYDMLDRDVKDIVNCQKVLEKYLGARKIFDQIKAAVLDRDRVDLQNCKAHIDESIRNMAFMMVFEAFEDDAKSEVVSKLSTMEAKNFWIQRVGVTQKSIGNDGFAKAYHKYLSEIHGWDDRKEVIQEHVLRQIVASTIDIGGLEDNITLDEFDSFVKKFKPLSKSFLKIACLCDQQGNRFSWFVPLNSSDNLRVKPNWLLRLNKAGDAFTLEVFFRDRRTNNQIGKARRIMISDKGQYFCQTESKENAAKPREYDNLVKLLETELPLFYHALGLPAPDPVPHDLDYWTQVEQGVVVDDHEAEVAAFGNYNASAKEGAAQGVRRTHLDVELVSERLDRIERNLAKLMEAIAARGESN